MGYLFLADYRKQIQSDNLQQIIGNDYGALKTAELQAIEEAYGYLTQKYDTSAEFTETLPWVANKAYSAGDRVYLDADAYSTGKTYVIGALCLLNGAIYRCETAITTPEAFTPAKWALLGQQYDLFYAAYPGQLFDYQAFYETGSTVFYKGKVYTARRDSVQLDYVTRLQYQQYGNLPSPSVFPDDPNSGNAYWGNGVAYSVASGTLVTDATKWTLGDNRTQSVVMVVIDIALFHLHSRIAPRNVPDLRKERYANAVQMLQAFARGEMTARLPIRQPKQGARIRYGGNIKQTNSY